MTNNIFEIETAFIKHKVDYKKRAHCSRYVQQMNQKKEQCPTK